MGRTTEQQGKDTILECALSYLCAGFSLIPIGSNKAPLGKLLPRNEEGKPTWKPFQEDPPTEEDVRRWYGGQNHPGIALVGGDVSGALECLDFDHDPDRNLDGAGAFREWLGLVQDARPDILGRLAVIQTPRGGYHVWLRCPDIAIPGNHVLAKAPNGKDALIETRGEGGYALAPGSPGRCHPTGKEYIPATGLGCPLVELGAIGIEEHEDLHAFARSLDQRTIFTQEPNGMPQDGTRPGDEFDLQGPPWSAILEPHGWVLATRSGEETRWRRPGKDHSWSATTGKCKGSRGEDLLRVFSSGADPFEEGKAYGKFRAYALLNHNGNLSEAGKALRQQGYGQKCQVSPGQGPGQHQSNGRAGGPQHTWKPKRLGGPIERREKPELIAGLFYPDKRHLVFGESGCQKTWLALCTATAVVQAGGEVAWIDHEMTDVDVQERLDSLGCTDEQRNRVFYIKPHEALADGSRSLMERFLATVNPRLVVIDAFAGSLGLAGWNDNSATDIEKWIHQVGNLFWGEARCLLVLDHVPKSSDGQSRFSLGSQRKLGGVDVGMKLSATKNINQEPGSEGVIKVQITKDRYGWLRDGSTREVHLTHAGEGKLSWRIQEQKQDGKTFEPTVLMEAVSRYLESQSEPVSRREVVKNVRGKREKYKNDAIDCLLEQGFIEKTEGSRRAELLRSVRPYHQDPEPVVSSGGKEDEEVIS